MTIQDRAYQERMIEETRGHWRAGIKDVIIESATGSGKTVIGAKIMRGLRERGRRSWFGVDRTELVDSTANTFTKVGVPFGIIAAGKHCGRDELIQIVSIPTAVNMLDDVTHPYLMTLDEAQGTAAATWQKLYGLSEWHIGLSATPIFPGGKPMGKYYKKMVNGPTVPWLIENKFLCDFRYIAPDVPDFSACRMIGGEYSPDDVEKIMAGKAIVGNVVETWVKQAYGKVSLGFATTVKQSKAYVEAFTAAGIRAAHVDGTTPKDIRRAIFEALARREIDIVYTVDIVSKGFDIGSLTGLDITIECIIMTRPTKSYIVCKQQWGRSMRPQDEKSVIIDSCGNWTRHGFPDDIVEWKLDGPPMRIAQGAGIAITRCPECYAVFRPAVGCPDCGHQREVKERPLVYMEGELKEIERRAKKAAEQVRKEKRAARKKEIEAEKAAEAAYKAGPCKDRTRYTSMRTAHNQIYRIKQKNPRASLEPYQCGNCGNIHLGRPQSKELQNG